jgi:CRP-like cAMP-binding protein
MGTLIAPDALKTQLESVGSKIQTEKGTFLFRRGDTVAGVYLILSGQLRLGLEREPRGFPSRLLGPGSVVGLPATVSESPYSFTAEIVQDAEMCFVRTDRLRQLLRDQPQLCFDVMKVLTEELTQTRAALERLHEPRP